ncbi:MAG: hypothetical protein DID92_2727742990 [Candidatus Nitrotoga sp. SPKER]|nr:MAG: hypothetical protein DID92_2727742990 [Candidatus Nitrotoga sp. SPKER]
MLKVDVWFEAIRGVDQKFKTGVTKSGDLLLSSSRPMCIWGVHGTEVLKN